jgi:phosphate transport system substrate-binding protein
MKRFSKIARVFTAVTLLVSICSLGVAADKIIVKGSDTLGAKLVPQLAEEFKTMYDDVVFEIAAEGSTTGLTAVIDKTADIGISSRAAKRSEITSARLKGVKLNPVTVCYDGMAVIVNENSPIQALSLRQVEQIFTGDIEDWAALCPMRGNISIYTRNSASGTYQDFKAYAMRRRDYAPHTQKLAGNEQIAAEVAKNPNGIGYVGLAYIYTPGVKVIKVDGVLPNLRTVNDKSYPLSRPNFFYTNGESEGVAKDFIDFTLSQKGQEIVSRVGFVPLQLSPEHITTSGVQ